MKIGINTRYLQNIYNSGIETYITNLIVNLRKLDNENEYTLFFGSNKNLPEFVLNSKFRYDISKIHTNGQLLKFLWAQLYLPYVIKKYKIDIFHETSFVAPVYKNCLLLTTVYDLAYLYVPYCFTYRTWLYFKNLVVLSVKQSDLIIAVSENTKKDIINNFSISPKKVKVIYGGVDDMFKPITNTEEKEKIKGRYKIKKDFVLSVSLISPRKNLTTLIKAFKLLRKQKGIDIQLVIVGKKGWLYEDIFKEVELSGLNDDIIFCGYIPKNDLVYLYNAAIVFTYPSLYEGFGLPVLEAMACGCPVISSNVSSLPEVCGDAAVLVDPKNVLEISEAIYRLFIDKSLRGSLIKKGFEQAKKFSWEKTAKETLAAYTQIIHK